MTYGICEACHRKVAGWNGTRSPGMTRMRHGKHGGWLEWHKFAQHGTNEAWKSMRHGICEAWQRKTGANRKEGAHRKVGAHWSHWKVGIRAPVSHAYRKEGAHRKAVAYRREGAHRKMGAHWCRWKVGGLRTGPVFGMEITVMWVSGKSTEFKTLPWRLVPKSDAKMNGGG
eukprot:1159673-Pelagomonas_calceolata.AAC.11